MAVATRLPFTNEQNRLLQNATLTTELNAAQQVIIDGAIRFYAQRRIVMRYLAREVLGLKGGPGRTIRLMYSNNIGRGERFNSENQLPDLKKFALTTRDITVYEYGDRAGVTALTADTLWVDAVDIITQLLGQSYAETIDYLLMTTALTRGATRTRYAPRNGVLAQSVTTRAGLRPNCYFSEALIQLANVDMRQSLAQRWANKYWVCVCTPQQLASIKLSPGWVNREYYKDDFNYSFWNITAGMLHGVVFVDTMLLHDIGVIDLGDYNGSAFTDVHRAILLGREALGLAFGLGIDRDVELRKQPGRFGLNLQFMWRTLVNAAILRSDDIMILESAGMPGYV